MGSGIPREVTAVELEGLEPQPPPQLCGEQTPGLPRLTLLSSPVHGLRGSPPVHEGFGFQHQDAGHQVSSASPHGLLLLRAPHKPLVARGAFGGGQAACRPIKY